jgi:hypothetical protein
MRAEEDFTSQDSRQRVRNHSTKAIGSPAAPRPNIADRYADLLRPLPRARRDGMIGRISRGFYDGWIPSRDEVADLVAVDLGILTIDECIERHRQRRLGTKPIKNYIPIIASHQRLQ